MSESINEQLSALIDGELSAAEEQLLHKRLERDAAPRLTMTRYMMIGECLRGTGLPSNAVTLGERVREAIEREPVHSAAPAPDAEWLSRSRGFIAAGVAAAVAVVAVMTFRPGDGAAPGIPSAQVAATTISQPAPAEPVSYTTPVTEVRRATIAPARLTTYLVSHGEYANGLSRQVLDSYVVNSTADVMIRESVAEPRP